MVSWIWGASSLLGINTSVKEGGKWECTKQDVKLWPQGLSPPSRELWSEYCPSQESGVTPKWPHLYEPTWLSPWFVSYLGRAWPGVKWLRQTVKVLAHKGCLWPHLPQQGSKSFLKGTQVVHVHGDHRMWGHGVFHGVAKGLEQILVQNPLWEWSWTACLELWRSLKGTMKI